MDPSTHVSRGVRALRRLLRTQCLDVRDLTPDTFRTWLDRHLARWRRDPVFVQRVRIRDVRRANPQLRDLEREVRQAARAEAAAPNAQRLARLARELADTGKAVAGLTAALARSAADRRRAVRDKLAAFQRRRQALEAERAALVASTPEHRALLAARDDLRRFRASISIDTEEDWLRRLLTEQGRRSGRGGTSFEQTAWELAERLVVPEVVRGNAGAGVRVLRGVTLGAARTELDQAVVRPPRRAGRPVDVLAIVEVKRNINDVAHGFRQRQADLAWLTGDAGSYDPASYRTRNFRTGHFDREATHTEQGEAFVFDRTSFARFHRDAATTLFVDRLYFITRAGPLWGMSAAAVARVGFRVATDERWAPESDEYLAHLLGWCHSLTHEAEAPDVLRLYASSRPWGRQVLLVDG